MLRRRLHRLNDTSKILHGLTTYKFEWVVLKEVKILPCVFKFEDSIVNRHVDQPLVIADSAEIIVQLECRPNQDLFRKYLGISTPVLGVAIKYYSNAASLRRNMLITKL